MRRHLLLACAGSLAMAACGEQFKPPSYIDKLRLLAIRAEAPEIVPQGSDGPDRTTFTSLVADPLQLDEQDRQVVVAYLACTPEPGSLEPGICNLVETYADPARLPELLRAGGDRCDTEGGGGAPEGEFGQGITGGITFSGFEVCDHETGCRQVEVEVEGTRLPLPPPTYVLPADFSLDELPAGHPQRTNGVQVLAVTLVVQASPRELLEGADPAGDACTFAEAVSGNLARLLGEREQITALKRVQVRGPDVEDELNVNPAIPGFLADGEALPAELAEPIPEATRFRPAEEVKLLPQLPTGADGQALTEEELYQPYTRYDAEGAFFREEREAWLWSWFTTGGEFGRERTRQPSRNPEWTAPTGKGDDPIPAGGRVFLYSVVRDARGGIDWARREVRVD